MRVNFIGAMALSCISLAAIAGNLDAVEQKTSTQATPVAVQDNAANAQVESNQEARESILASDAADTHNPTAENIDLKEVIPASQTPLIFPESDTDTILSEGGGKYSVSVESLQLSSQKMEQPNHTRHMLGVDVPPSTTTRLNWTPSRSFAGMAVDTPVLAVNGAWDGPTLCITAAIHGDELNGIEMVRRVLYELDPAKLHGMVVGVPIVNLLGFSRNSRYLPDRRDLNRHFPGNTKGSVASRLAYGFFNDVIKHCSALVDLHTGSFHRTNITQLRADMSQPLVAEFVELFGDIPVLNTRGNRNSLRAAAVRAGIPTVTIEAGEPMRMQVAVVDEGVRAINTLMEKNGMYSSFSLWAKPSPAFYRSTWVRSNASGILFSKVELGADIAKGDLLGSVINPVSNEKKNIISQHKGRVLGMALDQFVLPGFAAYHIGIREPSALKLLTEPEQLVVDSDDERDGEGMMSIEITEPEAAPLSPEEEGFDD